MKRNRGKAVLNLFRRGPLVELVNNRIERNPRTRQANCAIAIFKQWIARCEHDTHGLNISDMLPIFERSFGMSADSMRSLPTNAREVEQVVWHRSASGNQRHAGCVSQDILA